MPARMRVNGIFSDTSLELLHSVSTNRMSLSDTIDLDSQLNWCHLYFIPFI